MNDAQLNDVLRRIEENLANLEALRIRYNNNQVEAQNNNLINIGLQADLIRRSIDGEDVSAEMERFKTNFDSYAEEMKVSSENEVKLMEQIKQEERRRDYLLSAQRVLNGYRDDLRRDPNNQLIKNDLKRQEERMVEVLKTMTRDKIEENETRKNLNEDLNEIMKNSDPLSRNYNNTAKQLLNERLKNYKEQKEEPINNGPENNDPENNGPENNGPENNGPENNGPENNGPENNGPENNSPEKEGENTHGKKPKLSAKSLAKIAAIASGIGAIGIALSLVVGPLGGIVAEIGAIASTVVAYKLAKNSK